MDVRGRAELGAPARPQLQRRRSLLRDASPCPTPPRAPAACARSPVAVDANARWRRPATRPGRGATASRSRAPGRCTDRAPPAGSPHAARDQTVTNPSATPRRARRTTGGDPSAPRRPGDRPVDAAHPAGDRHPAARRPGARRRPAARTPPAPARRPSARPDRAPPTRATPSPTRLVSASSGPTRPRARRVESLGLPAASAPAAAVGAATHTTTVAGWAAALVVAALLGARRRARAARPRTLAPVAPPAGPPVTCQHHAP